MAACDRREWDQLPRTSESFSGLGWGEESLVHTQAGIRLEMITGWLLRGLCRTIIALGPFPGLPASCHRSSFVWILVHVLVGW